MVAKGPTEKGLTRVPERWRSTGAAAGFVAATLLVVELGLLASSPTVGSPAGAIVHYLQRNHATVLVSSYVGTMTALALIPFLASLKTFVERTEAADWWWTVSLLSGAVALAAVTVGNGLLAAAAELSGRVDDAPAVVALFAGAKLVATFSLIPVAGVAFATARTMSATGTSVRWLVRFGTEIGILTLASGAVVFLNDTWFGPGEPVVAAMGFLIALWVAATSVVMVRFGDQRTGGPQQDR